MTFRFAYRLRNIGSQSNPYHVYQVFARDDPTRVVFFSRSLYLTGWVIRELERQRRQNLRS